MGLGNTTRTLTTDQHSAHRLAHPLGQGLESRANGGIYVLVRFPQFILVHLRPSSHHE